MIQDAMGQPVVDEDHLPVVVAHRVVLVEFADEEAVVREIDKQGAIIQGEYSDVDDIFFQRPEDE